MNIETLLVIIVLFFGGIGFLFMAVNRKRKINEESFLQRTKLALRVEKQDKFNETAYKSIYFTTSLITSILFFVALAVLLISLNGSIRDLTEQQLKLVTIIANFAALVFVSRKNIIDLVSERFITRHNHVKKQQYRYGFILVNIVVLAAFVYSIILYITN